MAGQEYSISRDVRFGPLEKIDVHGIAAACREQWFNQTLCRVNDCVVRLGVVRGEFHWHEHDREDEYFHVVEGKLLVELEGRTVGLEAGQGVMVPRGVRHRTRAPERTIMLMVEAATVTPTGDAKGN